MSKLEKIEFHGWRNCLLFSNDELEMVITTDVGPRILKFGWKGREENLFFIDEQTEGITGGDDWHLYGGHRLWHSPEIKPRTYVPDNTPVAHDFHNGTLTLVQDVEQLTGLQKVMEIRFNEEHAGVAITHKLINHGPWEVTAAPWALTVLAPGGVAIIPQEPFKPFPDALLPARPVVLWSYTDMGDPRFEWRADYVAMRQDPAAENPLKFGVRSSVGWGCYALGETAFIKSATLDPEATYPDFGCNWELFTDSNFLELETLGPLAPIVASGGCVVHEEEWTLAKINPSMTAEEIFHHVQDLTPVTV